MNSNQNQQNRIESQHVILDFLTIKKRHESVSPYVDLFFILSLLEVYNMLHACYTERREIHSINLTLNLLKRIRLLGHELDLRSFEI